MHACDAWCATRAAVSASGSSMTQKPATYSSVAVAGPVVARPAVAGPVAASPAPARASTRVASAGAETPAANTIASAIRALKASTAAASASVAEYVLPTAAAWPSSMTLTRNCMASPLLVGGRLLSSRTDRPLRPEAAVPLGHPQMRQFHVYPL
ncbi:hypothetical protein BIU95_12865 [Curtobacterium sp. MCBA15_007]|nr:hypothetical protein BIU95_12865 [Curtobacterium sp. MCBA15_007]